MKSYLFTYKSLLCAAFLTAMMLVSSISHGLNLIAEVDRTNIAINESLRLIITADETTSETIDLSQLALQFDIVNNQRSSQTSIVNGSVSTKTQWILILMPRETGQLIIPSFELNGSYTQAITINVTDVPNAQSNASSTADVFLQFSVDQSSVYVQQQILLTARLYYRIALSSYDADELKLPDTTIELVDERNYEAQFQGSRYKVLEKVYALHPQSSGTLTIPSQRWRLERSIRGLGFGRSGNPYVMAKSEPITISVKPIPSSSTATQWLPAKQLRLKGEWLSSTTQASVGEPLNYQLTITAEGLTAAQLPQVSLVKNENFNIFSDQAQLADNKDEKGITGSRTQVFALIPKKTGQLTLPAIKVLWWNIEADREEEALIPAQTVIVGAPSFDESQSLPALPTDNTTSVLVEKSSNDYFWKLTTLLFAISTFLLIIILWRSKIADKKISVERPENNKNKYTVIKKIRNAAEKDDLFKLRELIIKWGSMHFGQSSITTLDDLARQIPDAEKPLKKLDEQLYSTHQDQVYNFHPLVELITRLDNRSEKRRESTDLKTLYK